LSLLSFLSCLVPSLETGLIRAVSFSPCSRPYETLQGPIIGNGLSHDFLEQRVSLVFSLPPPPTRIRVIPLLKLLPPGPKKMLEYIRLPKVLTCFQELFFRAPSAVFFSPQTLSPFAVVLRQPFFPSDEAGPSVGPPFPPSPCMAPSSAFRAALCSGTEVFFLIENPSQDYRIFWLTLQTRVPPFRGQTPPPPPNSTWPKVF